MPVGRSWTLFFMLGSSCRIPWSTIAKNNEANTLLIGKSSPRVSETSPPNATPFCRRIQTCVHTRSALLNIYMAHYATGSNNHFET